MTKLLAVLALVAAAAPFVRAAGQWEGEGGARASELLPFAVGAAPEGCDVGQGEWVYDEAARPAYEEEACPYVPAELTCQAHGRPDKSYQHWRWQPRGCSLPRLFDDVLSVGGDVSIENEMLQRDGDAGDAAREADAVRGRRAEPGAVRVAAVPPPPRRPGGIHLLRDRRRPQHLQGQVPRRHHRVLLGSAPRRVQRRRRRRPPAQPPAHPRRAHGPPLPLLEGRRRPRLQLLSLVDDRRQDPDPEGRRQRHEQGHRGDGGGGGVQAGAAPGGAVAGRQRGPQEVQGLLRDGVADARQRAAVGRRGGGQQLPRPDGADRGRVLLGEHQQGDAAGGRRGAGRVGEGAGGRGERHANVRVPPGRAHAGVQGAVGAADERAARRPQELRRLHALVPPRRARRLERAALLEALLPRQRPGALTRRRRSNMHRTYSVVVIGILHRKFVPFFGNVIKCAFLLCSRNLVPLHVGCVPYFYGIPWQS